MHMNNCTAAILLMNATSEMSDNELNQVHEIEH